MKLDYWEIINFILYIEAFSNQMLQLTNLNLKQEYNWYYLADCPTFRLSLQF